MLKIFFAVFFIAELIIVLTIIIKIHQFNKFVNDFNTLVLEHKVLLKDKFIDFRVNIHNFVNALNNITDMLNLKKREYLSRILETSITYAGILFLKGKYKKAVLAYQVIKEIYEVIDEAKC